LPSVSSPASAEEAAALLAEAGEAGTRVSIERAGGDLVLSTARLDRLLAHAWGDLTATAQAGLRLSELNAALAERGQTFALDPPGDPTLGACIAGNLSGPRRHRYGTARDLVLGATVVLADGTVASSGGTVVKNVAGYDLGKLLCGSRGTLGLIVRASLRLHPLPAVARTLVVELDGSEHARRLVRALGHSPLVPSAVDLLWPEALLVLFEGSERAVDEQLRAASALLGGGEGGDWEAVAVRQLSSRGRRLFAPGDLRPVLEGLPSAVVRPSAGVAYVPEPVEEALDEPVRRLNERVRHEFDPERILVA